MERCAGGSSDTASEPNNSATPRAREDQTPLPVKQILVIVAALLAEPLTNSIIRSFDDASNSAVNLHNVPGGEMFSGICSKLMESSLFLAKAVTAYQWGRLSDKLGRRPILLMGPLGLGVSTWILGVANNTWLQTSARSMQGVFGGNLETTKTVIAEMTDDTNRHRAYAAIPFVQNAGISIGSSLGSMLATLDDRFPFLVELPFVSTHPRLIPCTIAAAFSLFSFHLTYHGFEETLPPEFKIDWKVLWNLKDRVQNVATSAIPTIPTSTTALLDQARDLGYNTVQRVQDTTQSAISSAREGLGENINAMVPAKGIKDGLRLKEMVGPQFIMALLNYAFISFVDQAQQTLVPLVYTTPVEQGGLGLSADEMSTIMAQLGSYSTPGQLLLFPWLLQRYGARKVYGTCLRWMVAFFALFPVLIVVKSRLGDCMGLLSMHATMSSLASMAYGSAQLLIMEAVRDKRSLGSVNGIAQSVGSSARMVAPPFISIFFALGGRRDGGVERYSIYVVLVCVAAIGAMMSSMSARTPAVVTEDGRSSME